MQKLKSVQVDRLAHNNLCNCEQKSLLARTIRLLHSFIPRKKAPPMRCLLVELKAAKTHTVLYQINRTEYYCQVDLPLSDYPLYGKQLVASRG